jgi:hypothetical protein
MPFIFPKRFLRTRDVLDPFEMAQDYQPAQEVLSGELDRHNFNATHLKANVDAHTSLGSTSDPAVADEAYYKFVTASVEAWPRMNRHMVPTLPGETISVGSGGTVPLGGSFRDSFNFVELDGVTFRNTPETGEGYPSIIPNTGEWSAVKNLDLSDSLFAEVKTGRANLWINCFLQYVWQGWFEYAPPWIYYGDDSAIHGVGGWEPKYTTDTPEEEYKSLNNRWPTSGFRKLYAYRYGTTTIERALTYNYPLNECDANWERRHPNKAGYHHISKGFFPALVQFAIRVDGKVIDESITGKKYSFEESCHGLKIADSPIMDEGDLENRFIFGQRSSTKGMTYEQKKNSRPGQKIRSTRAAACGPEVLPVRLGCVIPVTPGTHKIEIVARRLQRKRHQFTQGDYVGVFSRRICAMSLPVTPLEGESTISVAPVNEAPVNVPAFQTESKVDQNLFFTPLAHLTNRANELSPRDIKTSSIPSTHLPSKIKYFESRSHKFLSGWDSAHGIHEAETAGQISAVYPGDLVDSLTDTRTAGTWPAMGGTAGTSSWEGRGWQKIESSTGLPSITPIAGNLHVESGKTKLLILADIEVLNIETMLSQLAMDADEPSGFTAEELDDIAQAYKSFIQAEKYLDLFAYFAIGYRTGSDDWQNWVINSKYAPGIVNNFNWTNRNEFYTPMFVEGVSLVEGAGGHQKGGVNYSYSTGDDRRVDRRGGNCLPTNLNVNIPLMLLLEDTVDITEIALFGATNFPSIWDINHATAKTSLASPNRQWHKADGTSSGADVDLEWISPVDGRGILEGVKVNIGRCRLSVIKFLV